jgi:hypothetical protein
MRSKIASALAAVDFLEHQLALRAFKLVCTANGHLAEATVVIEMNDVVTPGWACSSRWSCSKVACAVDSRARGLDRHTSLPPKRPFTPLPKSSRNLVFLVRFARDLF